MKSLFGKTLKPFALSKAGESHSQPLISVPTLLGSASHTTGLQPKYLVPPVPHPCPHNYLSLLVTKDGLLIRPYTAGLSGSAAHVRIGWGKSVRVEETTSEDGADEAEWESSVVVYGVIGILELFSGALSIFNQLYEGNLLMFAVKGSHLLVITSKAEVGTSMYIYRRHLESNWMLNSRIK
jgi:phosphatidylinositol 4-phosphatase